MGRTNHTSSWPELTAILLIRLSVLWLLVLLALSLSNEGTIFPALMGIVITIAIPYSLWLSSKLHSNRFAPLQFLVDFVLVTGLICFTGGIHSDLTLLYPLLILSASIVVPPRQAVEVTILGIIVYMLVIVLHSQDVLFENYADGSEATAGAIFPALILRAGIFSLFGMAGLYVSKRCNYSNRQNQDAKNSVRTLLENLNAGILLLDRHGRILSANPTACDLLHATADQLSTQTFSDLRVSGLRPISDLYGQTAYLERLDAPPVPVTYRSADVELPAAAIPGLENDEATVEVTLLVLSDLSRPLLLERQLDQMDRVTAATRIASEMANEIRAPLTTISTSIQLLQHYEINATITDNRSSSPRKEDRMELFSHILGASDKMDTVIQNFADFTQFSPEDLLSIIKLDSNAVKER